MVRIDSRGVARPLGASASRRLSGRAGTFRLLPAPHRTLLMRKVRDDGSPRKRSSPPVRLTGELTEAGDICNVLAFIGDSGWRGRLLISDGQDTRALFLDSGAVVGVKTTCAEERLGAVLYRYGAIREQQLKRILDLTGSGRRFSEAALQVSGLVARDLYGYIGRQIKDVVFASFDVDTGAFCFLEGEEDAKLVTRQALSISGLLFEGATRMDELRHFRKRIPSSSHIPRRRSTAPPPPAGLADIYGEIDGRTSIAELGRRTGRGEFEVTKGVYALLQSSRVTIDKPRLTDGPREIVELANEALRLVFREAGEVGRAELLGENLARFAAGAGVYDVLFRNAGPAEDGSLDSAAVLQNAQLVAFGNDPEALLKGMLHEYVSFALFCASSTLGRERETALRRRVAVIMAELRPTG